MKSNVRGIFGSSPFISIPPYLTKHTQKKIFLPIFSPKFSIHLISPPNKHILKPLVPERQSEVALVTKLPTITFGAVSLVTGPPTPVVKTMFSVIGPSTLVAMQFGHQTFDTDCQCSNFNHQIAGNNCRLGISWHQTARAESQNTRPLALITSGVIGIRP